MISSIPSNQNGKKFIPLYVLREWEASETRGCSGPAGTQEERTQAFFVPTLSLFTVSNLWNCFVKPSKEI